MGPAPFNQLPLNNRQPSLEGVTAARWVQEATSQVEFVHDDTAENNSDLKHRDMIVLKVMGNIHHCVGAACYLLILSIFAEAKQVLIG